MVILSTTTQQVPLKENGEMVMVTELTDDQLDELIIKGKLFEEDEETDDLESFYVDLGGEG